MADRMAATLTTKYYEAVQEAERWWSQKLRRQKDLRLYYEGSRRGLDDDAIAVLVDKDQLVREAQLLHDRAVQRAAMYGPGAILEALGK